MAFEVDHVQITIPPGSEEEARRFYCGFLGLPEIEKPENRRANGGIWLQCGGVQVHLGVEDSERNKTRAHVAYRVDDLTSWRRKFAANSIPVSETLPFPDARSFEFRDPFGNRVELIERL